jgi:hypothetical protein
MDDLSGKAKDGELLPAEQLQSMGTTTSLVCLNFKVPLRIRQQFKIHAAEHNMSMGQRCIACAIHSTRERSFSRRQDFPVFTHSDESVAKLDRIDLTPKKAPRRISQLRNRPDLLKK